VSDRDVPVIRAAGGVVWRTGHGEQADEVEVVLVHRPRYDDWSLPKGKLEADERHKQAALREVLEETGLRCGLGVKLARITYDTPLGPKNVKWWAMQPGDPAADLGAVDPFEVSEVRWVPFDEAWSRLTYGSERDVLASFAHEVLGRH
jgi:8-oxo-dGTP diphosphatase